MAEISAFYTNLSHVIHQSLIFPINCYKYLLVCWVVRESVKKTLQNKKKFTSREELVGSVKKIGKIKYNFDFSEILNQSKIIREKKEQKNLGEFL